MGRSRVTRRRDGVFQIHAPTKRRLGTIAFALALGAVPMTLALVLVLPVLILELPPIFVACAIAFLLLFLERRHAARALARHRSHLRLVTPRNPL